MKESSKSEYSNSKPFEYKYKHNKQDSVGSSKQGNTFDYTKPSRDPISNFTSSNSYENRSKMKNKKNSSKIGARTIGSDSISPKTAFNYSKEPPTTSNHGE